MFKMRVALLGVLALFIVSGIAASTASAAGPYWHVNGSRLESGAKQLKLQNKTTAVLAIPSIGLEIECKSSISEGATIEGNGANQGQDKGRITYTSCKSNAAGCTVGEPITTKPTKSYLAIAATQTKIVDVFEPTEGTLFVTIKLAGGSCLLAGSYEVTGGAVAEVVPAGTEAVEGLLSFPKTAITSVKHEGGAATTIELKTKGLASTFSSIYGAKLATGEKYGVTET
jgi:hypothetical protein